MLPTHALTLAAFWACEVVEVGAPQIRGSVAVSFTRNWSAVPIVSSKRSRRKVGVILQPSWGWWQVSQLWPFPCAVPKFVVRNAFLVVHTSTPDCVGVFRQFGPLTV